MVAICDGVPWLGTGLVRVVVTSTSTALPINVKIASKDVAEDGIDNSDTQFSQGSSLLTRIWLGSDGDALPTGVSAKMMERKKRVR